MSLSRLPSSATSLLQLQLQKLPKTRPELVLGMRKISTTSNLRYSRLQQIFSTPSTRTITSRTAMFPSSKQEQVRSITTTSFPEQQATKSSAEVSGEPDVLFEKVNGKGIITLNRPKALHALNLSMARKIYPVLREWESSQRFIIIKSSGGKAFCAGGDVRAVTESATAGQSLYRDFFREEYLLNGLIGTLHIPYIALIDGITMGGGVGLSVHGKYRVATERTLFAMPETRIGLFPDVGASHVLPRLGGKLGLFLALTGERLKGGDVFKAGIATHGCESSKLQALEQDLISLDPKSGDSADSDIVQVLNKYHEQAGFVRNPFSLEPKLNKINELFSGSTVEEILRRLAVEVKSGPESAWAAKIVETLSQMSPTSLKITLRLLELGANSDLQEALQMEYRLSQRCCENHDFIEGVRALLIDKDNNPQWKPSRLEDVTPEVVESYFAPLDESLELSL